MVAAMVDRIERVMLAAFAAWLAIMAAGCASAARKPHTATAPHPASPSSSAHHRLTGPRLPEAPGPRFPRSTLVATLDSAYASVGVTFDPSNLGIAKKQLQAHWYVVNGRWAAYLQGLNLTNRPPLCLVTADGPAHGNPELSFTQNATAPNGCAGPAHTPSAERRGYVELCGKKVVLVGGRAAPPPGEVPIGSTLEAKVERRDFDGSYQGVFAGVVPQANPVILDVKKLGCHRLT
jgi:hypothetical protein